MIAIVWWAASSTCFDWPLSAACGEKVKVVESDDDDDDDNRQSIGEDHLTLL